jgi:hypothetical protein
MNIRTSSGRKATSVMIAPSWFWTKNLNGSDQQADQQPEIPVVERLPVEQDNSSGLAGDGNDPRENRENAQALGGRLLAVRRTPILGDVGLCGWLVVGHVHISCIDASGRRSIGQANAPFQNRQGPIQGPKQVVRPASRLPPPMPGGTCLMPAGRQGRTRTKFAPERRPYEFDGSAHQR